MILHVLRNGEVHGPFSGAPLRSAERMAERGLLAATPSRSRIRPRYFLITSLGRAALDNKKRKKAWAVVN
jgi:hypothetical protein